MAKTIVDRIADGRVQKKQERRRSGNNLYGSKGKPKCDNCRLARRACDFKSTSEVCKNCARKGLKCGDKTRRGGPQDTVRITVLEQLSEDHPTWTLKDVIVHLHGGDNKIEYDLSCSPEGIGWDMIPSSSCATSLAQFDFMDRPTTLSAPPSLDLYTNPSIKNPKSYGLTTTDVSPALLKRELSQSCVPEDHYSQMVPSTPSWPSRLEPLLPPQYVSFGFSDPLLAVCSSVMAVADCRPTALKMTRNGFNYKRRPTLSNDPC